LHTPPADATWHEAAFAVARVVKEQVGLLVSEQAAVDDAGRAGPWQTLQENAPRQEPLWDDATQGVALETEMVTWQVGVLLSEQTATEHGGELQTAGDGIGWLKYPTTSATTSVALTVTFILKSRVHVLTSGSQIGTAMPFAIAGSPETTPKLSVEANGAVAIGYAHATRFPAPAGFVLTKLIIAPVAVEGTPHPVALPPWLARLPVPFTLKSLVVPAAIGPPARRVSISRQGLIVE
jgi:hypothetical protein